MTAPSLQLDLHVAAQPDDTTCGPTCLQAVYRYWGDDVELDDLIGELTALPGGGTLAVRLANHALQRGYSAEIYSYNLNMFDPTWFSGEVDLADRLRRQAVAKQDPKLALATEDFLEFLQRGGVVKFEDLNAGLIRRFLRRKVPILTGLSATYLYGCSREVDDGYDDIGGNPMGHFVVLSGYDPGERLVTVSDPLHDNPQFGTGRYRVGLDRLIGSILLGMVTYDANMLLIAPLPGRR